MSKSNDIRLNAKETEALARLHREGGLPAELVELGKRCADKATPHINTIRGTHVRLMYFFALLSGKFQTLTDARKHANAEWKKIAISPDVKGSPMTDNSFRNWENEDPNLKALAAKQRGPDKTGREK